MNRTWAPMGDCERASCLRGPRLANREAPSGLHRPGLSESGHYTLMNVSPTETAREHSAAIFDRIASRYPNVVSAQIDRSNDYGTCFRDLLNWQRHARSWSKQSSLSAMVESSQADKGHF